MYCEHCKRSQSAKQEISWHSVIGSIRLHTRASETSTNTGETSLFKGWYALQLTHCHQLQLSAVNIERLRPTITAAKLDDKGRLGGGYWYAPIMVNTNKIIQNDGAKTKVLSGIGTVSTDLAQSSKREWRVWGQVHTPPNLACRLRYYRRICIFTVFSLYI
jgi:hypothetical protein